MNKVILTGRLTRDWERQSGKRDLIRTTIAVDMGKDKTSFIPIVSFNERTMDANEKYSYKGSMIAVEGELSINNVQQDNGEYKTYANVIANRIEWLGNNKGSNNDDYHDNGIDISKGPETTQNEPKKESDVDGVLWE